MVQTVPVASSFPARPRSLGQRAVILIWFFTLCSLSWTAAAAQTGRWMPTGDARPRYSVIYTGRLFGYFRYPDVQSSSDTGCPAEKDVPLPPQVEQFRAALASLQSREMELVSMGDDFAPELLSRQMVNQVKGSAHYGELMGKNAFLTGSGGEGWIPANELARNPARPTKSGEGRIPSDNVGCFLRVMGFNAIVPGAEDFYFGAQRLRQIARFLAQPERGAERPVQMLAANLYVTASTATKIAAESYSAALRGALAPTGSAQFDLPSTAMPWLRTISVHAKADRLRVFDCVASNEKTPVFKLPSEPGNSCVELPETKPRSGIYVLRRTPHPSEDFVDAYDVLNPGEDHVFCAEYEKAASRGVHCERLAIHYPFLQFRPLASGATPAPYFVPEHANGAAIFGVLDPDIEKRIAEFTGRAETEVAVADPVDSLRQVIQLCDTDPSCRGRRRVLLAQMPFYKAEQLAARLKTFDLVVSQSDSEHATGDEYAGRSGPNSSSYVVTPGVAFASGRKDTLSTNLRRADYYDTVEGKTNAGRFMDNRVADIPVRFPTNPGCLTCSLAAKAAQASGSPAGSAGDHYAALALDAMQSFCHSDVALLQRRDVFPGFEQAVKLWPSGFSYGTQQLLDEVLWKGDPTVCVSVLGSNLQKILKDAAAYDSEDQDQLSLEVERGRGLYTLGIRTDSSTGTAFVKGSAIQDSALYAIALPRGLAFGNTGYSEFPAAAIPPEGSLAALNARASLSGLVCRQLSAGLISASCQTGPPRERDQLDALQRSIFARRNNFAGWLQLSRWASYFSGGALAASDRQTTGSSAAERVERRGLWWFRAQNLSVGYALTFIGGSDRFVPGFFVGNSSFSQFSTPEQSTLSFWGRVRGGYSFPRFVDFYASSEVKYTRAAIRTSTEFGNFGDYQINLPNNLMRDEVGFLSKPLPHGVPVRFLLSENLLTQITDPIAQFDVPFQCGPVPCTNASALTTYNLNKSYQAMTKFGARLQNSVSWIEAGREYGANINTAYDYELKNVGLASPIPCQISSFFSLSTCVKFDPLFSTESKIIPLTTTRHLAGWFLNFHSTLPLFRNRFQLAVDSYGELFDKRKDDTTFDTRYYEDLTLSLNVPIWGNLTFAPQVETFYFQNKVVPQVVQLNHYVFVTSSLKLDYSFDWHRGLGLGNALRYPAGLSNGVGETSR